MTNKKVKIFIARFIPFGFLCLFVSMKGTAQSARTEQGEESIETAMEGDRSHYVSNPTLTTILPGNKWKGNILNRKGRFVSDNYPFQLPFKNIFKWQMQRNPQKKEKKKEVWKLESTSDSSWLHTEEDCIVWLGHSTFYIRINGVGILTDPVFGNPYLLYKRKAIFPASTTSLLKKIDYVLITHDHRDHCDKKSLKTIAKSTVNVQYMVGLKMYPLIHRATGSNEIQAAGWYQKFKTDTTKIEIFFLPARHWSMRAPPFDVNKRLWGSFLIKSHKTTVYFSGDTGYGSHFMETGTLFPKTDYAIIPIGAYKPEWIMAPFHTSPEDAVKAFNEIGARNFIPAHYGTFDLADEPLSNPLTTLKVLNEKNAINGILKTPALGEVVYLTGISEN